MLATFGAVADQKGQWQIGPLGRWVLPILGTGGTALLGSPRVQGETGGICQDYPTARAAGVLAEGARVGWVTLGDLHEIIQIAFAWNNDHLLDSLSAGGSTAIPL